MYCLITVRTKRDQVVEGVVREVASRTEAMDLQIRRTAALLAPPPISHKNLLAKLPVSHSIQPKARAPLMQLAHADRRRWDENVCFSSSGKSS